MAALLTAAWLAGCSAPRPAPSSGGQGGQSLELGDAATQHCSPSSEAGSSDACGGSSEADYARDVAPIFSGCSGEICHNFSTPADVRWFVNRPTAECCGERMLISPGHPERSYLLDKLRGTQLCAGAPMPLDADQLSPAALATLSAWICQGASTP